MQRTVSCIFDGGLGNQLFQLAFARWLATQIQTPPATVCAVDGIANLRRGRSFRLNDLGIELPTARLPALLLLRLAIAKKLTGHASEIARGRRLLLEGPDLGQQITAIRQGEAQHIYAHGYWQDTRFAHAIRQEIRERLLAFQRFSTPGLHTLTAIDSAPTIAVHVRRGDYVSLKKARQLLLLCTKDYYHRGVSLAKERSAATRTLVFSDDIAWCRTELRLPEPVDFIDPAIPDFEQFVLMSRCHHFVISNSTFSWWAAFVANGSRQETICPEYWNVGVPTAHTHLAVERWTLIGC